MTCEENSNAREVTEIDGAKWKEELGVYEGDEDELTIIRGCPLCPICFHLLTLRINPSEEESQWCCAECKTQWSTKELAAAIKQGGETCA